MRPLEELDRDSILAEDIFIEIFEETDEIKRQRLITKLEMRAGTLGVKTHFCNLVKAYKRVERSMKNADSKQVTMLENWTNFDGPYENMYCGAWIASNTGIYAQNFNSPNDIVACYHPILPVERMKNLETGEERIKIAYKRNKTWNEIIVPKGLISSANRITSLSDLGISVTSENAKFLVKYLSDVENMNDDNIPVQFSSTKLGWIKGGFIPYDTEIIFDGDRQFKHIFESIKEHGNSKSWIDFVRALRKTRRAEILFSLAASFASVIVGQIGTLPFIVDLWGETEGGKSVSMMLAASIWANPDEGAYIGSFKTTDVQLEVKSNLLNHLPLMLDDSSKVSSRIRDNFESVIYDLCSGQGKGRSNKDLGIAKENRWHNVILTNGERPLASYAMQGGAINRILEVECGENVYIDPQSTAEFLKKNYGFAGRQFVEKIKELGIEKIKDMQRSIQMEIHSDKKMQKQSIALSVILTADRIATDYIFKDDVYINVEDAKKVLIDRNELSDNERCYQYILGEIDINGSKFNQISPIGEDWGIIEHGYAIILNNILERICKNGGFSKKSFLNWAEKNGLIESDKGRKDKVKRINGNTKRCVFLKMEMDETLDEQGFRALEEQEKLPF